MNKIELWDAYDNKLNKIDGITLVRGQPIPPGVYHLVCDVIVRHTDGTYLLMQRDPRKHHGLMWEATAGGSALRGETPLECAKRELREETGVVAHDLVEVGRETNNNSYYVEFFCITDCAKDSVILQEGETVAYKWVTLKQLLNMTAEHLVTQRMQQFLEELKQG